MYRSGQILYSQTVHPLFSYRPSSDLLYFTLLALVLSLLSYQLTAIIHDIFFGFKPHRKAYVHDLQTLLLTYSSSPLAVFRALFPHTFYRLSSKNDPGSLKTSESQANISSLSMRHFPRIARLFFLISVAPAVNILVLLASLESSETLSVSQAGLRGLAFSIPEQLPSVNTLQLQLPPSIFDCNGFYLSDCRHFESIRLRTSKTDVSLVDFKIAVDFTSRNYRSPSNQPPLGTAYVEVGEIIGKPTVAVYSNSRLVELSIWAGVLFRQLPGEEVLYFLPVILSNQSVHVAAERGQKLLASLCKEQANTSAEAQVVPDELNVDPIARYAVKCSAWHGGEENTFPSVASQMLESIALQDTEKLIVNRIPIYLQIGESAQADASDFPLISRRKSSAGLLLLTVILAIVLVVRIAVGLVLRNDLANGIGLILRDVGQVPWGDSMLGEVDVIVKYGEDFKVEPCLWEREDNTQKQRL
eukprot:GFKZ01006583.1.p1 GENE.GFKZ01006583.1~~GFKZ01006583.1.p1  ORF type:complete len:472 (-),score=40.02 GFKZ01006583.1:75-1490(-)